MSWAHWKRVQPSWGYTSLHGPGGCVLCGSDGTNVGGEEFRSSSQVCALHWQLQDKEVIYKRAESILCVPFLLCLFCISIASRAHCGGTFVTAQKALRLGESWGNECHILFLKTWLFMQTSVPSIGSACEWRCEIELLCGSSLAVFFLRWLVCSCQGLGPQYAAGLVSAGLPCISGTRSQRQVWDSSPASARSKRLQIPKAITAGELVRHSIPRGCYRPLHSPCRVFYSPPPGPFLSRSGWLGFPKLEMYGSVLLFPESLCTALESAIKHVQWLSLSLVCQSLWTHLIKMLCFALGVCAHRALDTHKICLPFTASLLFGQNENQMLQSEHEGYKSVSSFFKCCYCGIYRPLTELWFKRSAHHESASAVFNKIICRHSQSVVSADLVHLWGPAGMTVYLLLE